MTATSAPKAYVRGTHRIRSPEETWDWIAPILPRVGVTRVADVTRLDVLGLPVWQAVRPASRNLSVSQGKALTPEAARVSAAMESVELWHAEDLDPVPRARMPMREMRSFNPVDLSALPWRPDARRLDALPIEWVRARSLTRDHTAWLPRDLVELDFRLRETFRPNFFHRNSNGLASGNCLEEALLHGLCEVIERHGLWVDHQDPERRTALDPDDLGDDELEGWVERARGQGFRVALWDVTWEAGVPTMMADLVAPDLANVWRGSGCHPSPRVALSRALTEAAQARLTYISGARDDLQILAPGTPPADSFERFREPEPQGRLADVPSLSSDRIETDLERVAQAVDRAGYEPWAVDLSREELGVPVVRVVAPGLKEAPYG